MSTLYDVTFVDANGLCGRVAITTERSGTLISDLRMAMRRANRGDLEYHGVNAYQHGVSSDDEMVVWLALDGTHAWFPNGVITPKPSLSLMPY